VCHPTGSVSVSGLEEEFGISPRRHSPCSSPGEAIFVDSSTTGYFAVRRIGQENLHCMLLTNAVAIMDLLCDVCGLTPRRGPDRPDPLEGALRPLQRAGVDVRVV
jgi:hypothetical protein